MRKRNRPRKKIGEKILGKGEEINSLVKKENALIFEGDIATFNSEYVETMDGQIFGCSSYKDAWKLKEFNSPIFKDNDRTCGFHIHISYDLIDLEGGK